MKLKEGYELICIETDDNYCGDGGRSKWELRKDGQTVHTFESCHCGRGCGDSACVRDDWGYHDCEPEIEAVRDD